MSVIIIDVALRMVLILNGYDARFLIRELGKKYDTGKIGVIAENKEKYISFTVDVVVDSYMEDSGEVKDLRS